MPLSIMQEYVLRRELYESALSNTATQSTVRFSLWCRGVLESDALRDAVRAIVANHRVLRTSISNVIDTGAPNGASKVRIVKTIVQQVDCDSMLCHIDRELSGVDDDAISEEAERRLTGFDYSRPPNIAVVVLGRADKHAVIVAMPRIFTDGWSNQLVAREIMSHYKTRVEGIRDAPHVCSSDYEVFATWQRRLLSGGAAERLRSYWRSHYQHIRAFDAGHLPHALPAAPGAWPWQAGQRAMEIDAMALRRWRRAAQQNNVSMYVVGLSALVILLHLYTGDPSIGVWNFLSNRPDGRFYNVVGWFANGHVIGATVYPHDTVRDVFRKIDRDLSEAMNHQEMPFPIARRLFGAKGIAIPDATIDFNMIRLGEPINAGGVSIERMRRRQLVTGRALSFAVYCGRSECQLQILYSLHHIRAADAGVVLSEFGKLVERCIDSPGSKISELRLS